MKAVQVVSLTGPADVEVREVDPPTPGPHDVLVEVHSVGVSFPDLLLSRGEYQMKPEPPFNLGVDFAGVVLDPGSSDFTVGQRVAGVAGWGNAAEVVGELSQAMEGIVCARCGNSCDQPGCELPGCEH